MASPSPGASFESLGTASPAGPVVISVPHGGRDYPSALVEALRVPLGAIMPAIAPKHTGAAPAAT